MPVRKKSSSSDSTAHLGFQEKMLRLVAERNALFAESSKVATRTAAINTLEPILSISA